MTRICGIARRLMCTILVTALCVAAISETTPQHPSTRTITEVRMERGCFGCPTGSLLIVRNDGSLTYTVTGNARSGTSNQTSTGHVSKKTFARIARRIDGGKFYHLKSEYVDPQQQDGPWL